MSSPSIKTTRPVWISRMPVRFQLSLKRTACAASRLTSSRPPMTQPPGKGKLPDQTAPRRVAIALTTVGSCRGGELQRAHERLEGGFLFLHELGGAYHLHEPGLAAARHDDSEDALGRGAGRAGTRQIDVVPRAAGHIQLLHLFCQGFGADRPQADL